ncbi:MAG: ABC transporter ATP-binding protein [Egibacteraceae bacterium]
MAKVELERLTKVYPGGVRAVDSLDVTIKDGEFFALLGPSGCGKTTLLRTIAGLETATEGTIRIADRDVTKVSAGDRDIGMVFQDYALYPHMTVEENVAYPLKVRKVSKDDRREKAAEAAGSLDMRELLERRPGQLSGGQQQRVALARSIAQEPGVFLLDEPLSNLDARLRLESRTFLKRLQKELGITTIYVTHDQAEALALADRIAVMEAGQIRQIDAPAEVYNRPSSLFVASFIGSVPMNLLDGVVEDGRVRVGSAALPLPDDASEHVSSGDEVVVGVRPEHTTVSETEEDESIGGQVAVTELLGTQYLVTVEAEDISAQGVTRHPPEIGAQAWVTPEPEQLLIYRRADGGLVGTPVIEDAKSEKETASAAS